MAVCGYCGEDFDPDDNPRSSCRHHVAFYFPYDIDTDGEHTKGWQCCGEEDADAPGCRTTRHRTDVRRRYRGQTIAWDWVVVDEEAERRVARRAADQRARAAGMADGAALDGLVGLPLADVHARFGPGVHTAHVESGSARGPRWSESVYFDVRGLCFRVDTVPRVSSVHVTPSPPIVERVEIYADREHLDEVRSSQITSTRPD
ncbi:MAG: hypothetical protein H6734_25615 [Alphaproteobacteria bacterium]|nr:hypothetical protein [Alphaproteobacteria bacterium]